MPLLLALVVGLFLPRVVLVLAWCSGFFNGVWATWLWPLIGLIVLPYTTLAYELAIKYGGGVDGIWLVMVIIAVVLDLGSSGHSANTARRKRR